MLTAGIGFKFEHFSDVRETSLDGFWLEVHPENYMADGGPRPRMLAALRELHPVSFHGVSMSLGGPQALDADHLRRFANMVRTIEPVLVSEHLAWSRMGNRYEPDLLPIVRDRSTLERLTAHIAQVQDAIGRPIAIENPSHYVDFDGHEWNETGFLNELVQRSGCQLLVDVTNVVVSANNLESDAFTWIDSVPAESIAEIHLAGYSTDPVQAGLLIDSHDEAVAEGTWKLYQRLINRIGARPTLIERDGNVPQFKALLAERDIAHSLLRERGAP